MAADAPFHFKDVGLTGTPVARHGSGRGVVVAGAVIDEGRTSSAAGTRTASGTARYPRVTVTPRHASSRLVTRAACAARVSPARAGVAALLRSAPL